MVLVGMILKNIEKAKRRKNKKKVLIRKSLNNKSMLLRTENRYTEDRKRM